MDHLRFVWEKPVITVYKERFGNPEKDPFIAVKARRLLVSKKEKETDLSCNLIDFFPIMGDLGYVSTKKGKDDSFVLCWFDDQEDDFGRAFRRMTGVTFKEGIKCITDKNGKIACNAKFKAKYGKLS